jgi:putative chitinase
LVAAAPAPLICLRGETVSFPLLPDRISEVLPIPPGISRARYRANIAAYWPAVERALAERGITSTLALIAALAIIRVECPPFAPVKEYGGSPYFSRHYDGRADLGNTQPGDGALFCGRGFAQLTGRGNYAQCGAHLGVDLVHNPDAVLEPETNAAVFARFFADHHVAAAAEAGDWVRVRTIWNGGTNGLADFLRCVHALRDNIKGGELTEIVP